jgi:hypothetical protein
LSACRRTCIAGVTEILILRADRIAASLMRRAADATLPERPTELAEADLSRERIAFSVKLADAYDTTGLGK